MNHVKGFLPILLLLIAIVGGYFLTYPQWSDLSTNRTELQAAKDENATLKESQGQMNSFLNQYASLEQDQNNAEEIMPAKKADIQNFIKSLGEYAQQSTVFITGVGFTDASVKPKTNAVTYIDMKISASGNYRSLRDFIKLIEMDKRIVDIMTITSSLQQTNDPSKPSDLQDYTINARIYYQY